MLASRPCQITPFESATKTFSLLHAQAHHHVEAGDRRGAGAGGHQLDAADVLADDLQGVEQGGAGDDRGAVLVVVEDRDVHALAQLLLDVEALGRLDVFEVDAADGRLQHGDRVDQLVRIVLGQLEVEHVDPGEFLEQAALAFHDRLRGQRTDVAQAEDRGAVGDDRHQVAARGVLGGHGRIGGDFFAGIGHARRIGQRQVALVRQRLGRHDLDLAAGRAAVVFEGVAARSWPLQGFGTAHAKQLLRPQARRRAARGRHWRCRTRRPFDVHAHHFAQHQALGRQRADPADRARADDGVEGIVRQAVAVAWFIKMDGIRHLVSLFEHRTIAYPFGAHARQKIATNRQAPPSWQKKPPGASPGTWRLPKETG
jgi:hypothetical protein